MFHFRMLAVLAGVCVAQAAEPPPPDPKNPVDYVVWINAEFSKDADDNAAGLYGLAEEALVRDEDLATLAGTPWLAWSPQQRDAIGAWLGKNSAALDQLTAATAKERCYFALHTQDGALFRAMLGQPDLWALGRVLQLRGQSRLAANDVEGAMQDAIALLHAARHFESQPPLTSYLGGLTLRARGYFILLETPRTALHADFAAILARIELCDAGPSSPKLQYMFEKLVAWDTAQRILEDRAGDGRYIAEGAITRREGPMGDGRIETNKAIVFGPQTWDQVTQDIERYFVDLDKILSLEYPQAREAVARLKDRTAADKDSFMRLLSPNRTLALLHYARALAQHRGTLLVLNLHAYRATHGHWPAGLDSMLSASARRLAIDPFSARPFEYRLEQGEPLLYSVSENCADDGGEALIRARKPAWDETRDYVFWPPQP
jgi:hypothetical protein